VKVESVNTARIAGKPRRVGRSLGRTQLRKKAYVTLKEGQKIDMFEVK
jgi:large subunit ribosomal protein L23